jgi:LacI family transcriptional regulator, galactose operon repressor
MVTRNKITIHDIAEKAKVSISTVSRVLNHSRGVAEDKRQAVLQVIAEMNYKPNSFAQGLASGQSMTIGVLTQRISSPIYDTILLGILQGIDGSGYLPIFTDGNWDPQVEHAAIEKLIEKKVDGLIILGGNLPSGELVKLAKHLPLLLIGKDIPELANQCLRLDNFQGGYLATKYLIDSGHRRIAHLSGLVTHQDASDRRNGYMHALREAGIEINPELIVDGDYTESSGLMAVEMLLMRGQVFSAIFTANDQMALGVRLGLYRRGIRVPQDISIVGFDDQSSTAYSTPPLTTVHFPAMEMGNVAGKTILQLIKGEEYTLPVFQANLTVRESVARR